MTLTFFVQLPHQKFLIIFRKKLVNYSCRNSPSRALRKLFHSYRQPFKSFSFTTRKKIHSQSKHEKFAARKRSLNSFALRFFYVLSLCVCIKQMFFQEENLHEKQFNSEIAAQWWMLMMTMERRQSEINYGINGYEGKFLQQLENLSFLSFDRSLIKEISIACCGFQWQT